MKDIDVLTECINTEMKRSVGIIRHQNWKMIDFKKELFTGSIILFDTHAVGYGDFGEKNAKEINKNCWKNAIGIIQYINKGLIFTVIPKGINYVENIIKPYFNLINICMICKRGEVCVKIDSSSGLVICKTCYGLCYH